MEKEVPFHELHGKNGGKFHEHVSKACDAN